MNGNRLTWIRGLVMGLLLALGGVAAHGAAAQSDPADAAGAFTPAPCMFEGIDLGLGTLDGEGLGFECGYVVVPLRHSAPSTRRSRRPTRT